MEMTTKELLNYSLGAMLTSTPRRQGAMAYIALIQIAAFH
jgi:uncharacterized protein (UPF0261 family)